MTEQVLRREIHHSPGLLFDLVLDVESYHRFVPWWEAARVRDRQHNSYRTDQVVKFKMVRQRFSGLTTFHRPDWITVQSSGGAVRRFDLHWRFHRLGAAACLVEVKVNLELSSLPLQKMADMVSKDSVLSLLAAFEAEAARQAQVASGAPPASPA